MIGMTVGKCHVDILPVVNGLASEAEKVKQAYGGYDAYAASMGIESLEALRKREQIGMDDIEVSELDVIYAKKMSEFGDIITPSPAFCEIVDLCARDGINVIPLDMNDYDYDTAYMDCIKVTEFTSEHRLAKKGLKKKMDASTPEELAVMWDRHVSTVKGYGRLSRRREEHMASEIYDTAKYRSSLLAVVEVERVEGLVSILRDMDGVS